MRNLSIMPIYGLAVVAIFANFPGCNSNQDVPKETESVPAPPQVTVTITKVDDAEFISDQRLEIGRQVTIEGTISDPNVAFCVLVHPLSTDTWWTQNLPSPPEKIADQTWRWRTIALCGTEDLGLDEDYEIVAIAESKQSICQLGKTIKTEEFPKNLPRSAIITLRRVKN